MTTNHKHYLDLAFEIAKKNLGKTKLNPTVGTIIVKKNSVISSGVTSINGAPHAEFNALKNRNDFIGADLYTTLEPCVHYGKTPPCVNMIIKKKIKNVYYGSHDPDLRTYKKAKKILNKYKIKTNLIKSIKYKNFYSSYFFNKRFKLPYISAKIALSNDYYTINKKTKRITNENSKKISHLLRSENDCVFSTSKTINIDNALLNCRIDGFNNNKPDLFIVDLHLKLIKKLSIYKILNKRRTYLITAKKNKNKINYYKKKGLKILFVDSLQTKKDFYSLFKDIYMLGYSRVFFETGLTFLNTLIKYKLINDLYIFQSAKKLKTNGLNNSSSKFLKKIKLNKRIQVNLNNDSLYKVEF
jgi:diaminohydroxyphosphoribosylaminopyrimidine deaminase / 5-amino-6-(5-phosphoribosylamino)uracil reductase